MHLTGNSILITGGGSGIGRGLAQALIARGNEVIIAGRRAKVLAEVTTANPGMESIVLDVADAASIAQAAAAATRLYPALNVLINCAGIQRYDDASQPIDDKLLVDTVDTNLLGPIRLTSALLPHLLAQPSAAIVHVTSMLGYLPWAPATIYSASKAAMHSFALSQRYLLRGTDVAVLEIAPPYVQTDLADGADDPRAMRLKDFIAQTMEALESGADEVLVEAARRRRDTLRSDEPGATARFNDAFAAS